MVLEASWGVSFGRLLSRKDGGVSGREARGIKVLPLTVSGDDSRSFSVSDVYFLGNLLLESRDVDRRCILISFYVCCVDKCGVDKRETRDTARRCVQFKRSVVVHCVAMTVNICVPTARFC